MKAFHILFVLIVLLISCGKKEAMPESESSKISVDSIVVLTEDQEKSAGVAISALEEKDISEILKVNGAVDVPPQSMVTISIPMGGYLISTHLLPGMHVKKGEVLATLEDQQYIQLQEDYLVTQAKLVFAEAEFKRQRELQENQSTSDKIFQQARMEYDQTRVSLRALEEKLKLLHIDPTKLDEAHISRTIQVLSPINGFVSRVNVNIGKYVTPAEVMFELVNPEDIHLNLHVFEKDVAKLAIGQAVTAYTIHDPQTRYPCEVLLIGQSFSDDRTVEVHCHFKKYDKILLPGMYMNAEIDVKGHSAWTVPEEAIVIFEGKSYLFINDRPHTYDLIPVMTGLTDNGYIEILDAAKIAGRQIVTKGAYTLLMELKNKSEE